MLILLTLSLSCLLSAAILSTCTSNLSSWPCFLSRHLRALLRFCSNLLSRLLRLERLIFCSIWSNFLAVEPWDCDDVPESLETESRSWTWTFDLSLPCPSSSRPGDFPSCWYWSGDSSNCLSSDLPPQLFFLLLLRDFADVPCLNFLGGAYSWHWPCGSSKSGITWGELSWRFWSANYAGLRASDCSATLLTGIALLIRSSCSAFEAATRGADDDWPISARFSC